MAHAGYDLPRVFDETARLIRQAAPFDAACLHTLDPATLLETSQAVLDLTLPHPRATEIEYLEEDVNKFAHLARTSRVGILAEATGHRLERSPRYRELIEPLGMEGELRVVFSSGGNAWGAAGLLRSRGSAPFTREDAAFLRSVSEIIAHAIRGALVRAAAVRLDLPDTPGLILLGPDNRVTTVTPVARRWLAALPDAAENEMPYVVHAVAAQARRVLGGALDRPAHARVRTRSGDWVVLYGALLNEDPASGMAVIIERAAPPTMAPLIAQAYGLSERERAVLQLVLQGDGTREMAERLAISPYTVQEHLKSVFAKVGVRSRRELIGRVFYGQYHAHMNRREDLGHDGFFVPRGAAALGRN
ncbi:MAG TPA: LuxR C-terminal-related transcriptional regulator [Ktedonobacterales bacterium]|nr:LuxR C-terminal-related transcriptional regulator [Ktedonobacterales bacterium]